MDRPHPDVPMEALDAELQRLEQRAVFRDAPELKSLLQFLLQQRGSQEFHGQSSAEKESQIARSVFAAEDFDPSADPGVQVALRRLRVQLESYFSREGAGDPVRMVVPRDRIDVEVIASDVAPPSVEKTAAPVRSTPIPPSTPAERPLSMDRGSSPQPPSGTPVPSPDSDEGTLSWLSGRKLGLLILIMAVTGIGLGYWQTQSMRRIREAPLATVAVLPFQAVNGDPAAGMAMAARVQEQLNGTLGLQVVPWSETQKYANAPEKPVELADRFKASVMVTGRTREEGDLRVVEVRLSYTVDGTKLWSNVYQGQKTEPGPLAEQVARGVSAALRVTPGAQPQGAR